MSDFGRGTCKIVGMLIGALLIVAATGGLHDPAHPCYSPSGEVLIVTTLDC